jgi:serine/threonine-protein kinase
MTLMMMHLNDPVPDVRDFRKDASPELVEILEKCLAKDRNDRYLSAAELAADLRRALAYMSGPATAIRPKDMAKPAATIVEAPKLQPATTVEKSQPVSQPVAQPVVQTAFEPAPVTGSQPPPPASSSTSYPSAAKPAVSRRTMLAIGGGLAGLLCVGVVFALGSRLLSNIGTPPTSEPTATVLQATDTSLATEAAVVLASDTPAFTETPAETATPNATATPEGPYVVITDIQVQGNLYAVDYVLRYGPARAGRFTGIWAMEINLGRLWRSAIHSIWHCEPSSGCDPNVLAGCQP